MRPKRSWPFVRDQVSKFYQDHNAEAIDELDSVNAANGVPAGPCLWVWVEQCRWIGED
jgi:hypothetical protein